jgi:hypothetical protein
VPATFFFEDTPDMPAARAENATDPIMDFMATSEGLALAKAFMRIGNKQVRRRIVDLVEEIEAARDIAEGIFVAINVHRGAASKVADRVPKRRMPPQPKKGSS